MQSDATKMQMEWRFVTPSDAKSWLERNTANRRLNPTGVRVIASDIERGEYTPSHQGVAFYEDGVLADGQHRLHAIVKADSGAWMWVCRNVPRASSINIDKHRTRSDADVLQLAGCDTDKATVAVARAMIAGHGPRNGHARIQASRSQLRDFIETHRDALAFACASAHVRGATADFRAAVARAYYHVDHASLRRFLKVVILGPPEDFEPRDRVPLRLREVLLTSSGVGHGSVRRTIYQKTETAIDAYRNGRIVSRLVAASSELFPLPEEA